MCRSASLQCLLLAVVVLLQTTQQVAAHGRLIQPPARSTAWRYGFPTPANYNDHETYCGGFGRQWGINKGKCGPCGDPWDAPQPRDNEGGGKYGLGVITATYRQGAEVELGVELTANHNGFFEFRLCPHNSPRTPVAPECLEDNVLDRADGSGKRFYPSSGTRKMYMRYRLPPAITCQQCVLQWRYISASNWGRCPNGTGVMGCGPQEQFRACADIAILADDGSADNTPSTIATDEGVKRPAAPLPPTDQDQDYNEVDTDRLDGDHSPHHHHEQSNYVGHIIALTLAFVLLPLLLLAVVLYFYCTARDKLKSCCARFGGACCRGKEEEAREEGDEEGKKMTWSFFTCCSKEENEGGEEREGCGKSIFKCCCRKDEGKEGRIGKLFANWKKRDGGVEEEGREGGGGLLPCCTGKVKKEGGVVEEGRVGGGGGLLSCCTRKANEEGAEGSETGTEGSETTTTTSTEGGRRADQPVKSEKDLDGARRLDFPFSPFGVPPPGGEPPSAPPRRNRRRGPSVSPNRGDGAH